MVRKRRKVKAGYTVEAALLCPLLCLMICGMIGMTIELYNEVMESAEKLKGWNAWGSSVELIRVEAVAEEFLQEVTEDAGGI